VSPDRSIAVVTATLALLLPSSPASAQRTPGPEAATEQGSSEVVVTGTRDPSISARQSASPIVVVSAEELRATGQPDLRDALQQLAPSLSRQVMGLDQSSLINAISLRGLTADQTLVLVNGKRRHPTSAVNLNPGPQQGTAPVDIDLIPVTAIERVEILQDGAAALYGSDAIAGVINIILKGAGTDLSAQALNGQTYEGDGFTTSESISKGFNLGADGHLRLSAEVVHRDRTDRSGPDTRTGLSNNPAIGSPRTTRITTSLDAAYRVSSGVEGYAFATYAYRDAARLAYRRLPTVLPAVHPNGFQPIETVSEHDFAVTSGLRGEGLLGWHWDLSTTYGGDRIALGLDETANTGLYAATGETPTSVDIGSYRNRQWTNTLDLRRPVALPFLAAPVNLALGAEYRRETYGIDPGEPGSYLYGGTEGYQGLSPDNRTRASRDVEAAYIDLATRLLPAWQVDLAGRYEHYSDAGDTLTGKFSTRYDVSDRFALRGTVSNGFRAPTLAQSNFTSIVVSPTYANAQVAVASPAARALGASPLRPERSINYSAGVVARPLENLDITIDAYQVRIRDRIIAGGVYNGQEALDALRLQGITLPATVSPESATVQYYANGVRTRTRGLDISARYRTVLGAGSSVLWDAAANVNSTKVTRIGLDRNGNPLLNAQGIGYLTTAYPASKIIFGGQFSAERWSLALHEIRYGRTRSQLTYYTGPDAFSNDTFRDFVNRARWITNLEVGYDVSSRLRASIGANNLFNSYPSRIPLENSYIGAARYDTSSQQLGQDGGFYYLRLNLVS
jgi:iron complex outermembrane recepter protein